ncbi:MAG TPA: TMEM43 family protein [Dokdonella sp.]
MSKRARKASSSPIIGVVLLIVVAALLWFAWQQRASIHRWLPGSPLATTPADATKPPLSVSADRIDAANEGRTLSVDGRLRVTKPARDTQLGVSADAIALLRKVEMLQWQERCSASSCDYALAWSEQPVDSGTFRERKGHENSTRFPFAGARFVADDVRLGAFKLDAALAAKAAEASVPAAWPVHASQLPPNLAATFRERDGVLYAGAGPDKAIAGDLRVSYLIVAAGEQRLSGVQHGDRLHAALKP